MHENIKVVTLFAPLILVLSISTVVAQEFTIPDSERLQSMSHEEYDAYREQMRDRMDGLSPEEGGMVRQTGTGGREQTGKRGENSRYGQGYLSRNSTVRSGSGNTGSQQNGAYGRGSAGRR